ncbi:MAG: acetolactate synthase small subunit [Deferribacteraceae bacterium]|jgi:acetolactate synthase-1/3 small subunit|nr:acetolactate synthase small subunit [Deferribacteraceae bacterium]
MKKHIITLVVENKFGALARVSGLFSGRGYNIESLTVNETEKPGLSNMTIITSGDDPVIEQIIKQLRKLVNVLRVRDVTSLPEHIEREMALVKIHVMPKQRAEHFGIIEAFRARVIDMTHDSMIVEISGSEEKISSYVELVRPYGLIEVIRTGVLAMLKGSTVTTETSK